MALTQTQTLTLTLTLNAGWSGLRLLAMTGWLAADEQVSWLKLAQAFPFFPFVSPTLTLTGRRDARKKPAANGVRIVGLGESRRCEWPEQSRQRQKGLVVLISLWANMNGCARRGGDGDGFSVKPDALRVLGRFLSVLYTQQAQ